MDTKTITTAVASVFVGGVLTFAAVAPEPIEERTSYKKIDDGNVEITRVYVRTYVESIENLEKQIADFDRYIQEDPTRAAGLLPIKEQYTRALEAAEGLDIKDAINEEITL